MNLWSKAYRRISRDAIVKKNLKNTVTKHQDIFVNEYLPKAIDGVASCDIPIWLMSQERIYELIDGVDDLAVAELVVNLCSYDQFCMEAHLSIDSDILYILTVHHGYTFDNNKVMDKGMSSLDIFYGVDIETHIR